MIVAESLLNDRLPEWLPMKFRPSVFQCSPSEIASFIRLTGLGMMSRWSKLSLRRYAPALGRIECLSSLVRIVSEVNFVVNIQ